MSRIPSILCCLAVVSSASADCDPYYDIVVVVGEDCGIFGTAGITATGLSEEGIACGYMAGCADASARRAVLWDAQGDLAVLVPPQGTIEARAFAIQNGIVAGHMVNGGNKGFFYSIPRQEWTLVSPPAGGNWIEFLAINRHAEAVGWWVDIVDSVPPKTAAVWSPRTQTNLTLPIGPESEALDISDNGTIVGWMGIDPAPQFGAQAFMYKDGVGVALDMPKGAISSEALVVNNHDLIGGRCVFPHPSGTGHLNRATTWQADGSATVLPLMHGYDSSRVSCMDDHGQVFGSCFIGGTNQAVAVVWRDGEVRPFTFQYEPVPGLVSFGARLCNNAGQRAGGGLMQIDGNTFINVGVLLTPRPPVLGDTNCDRFVGIADLLGVLGAWGSADSSADLNDDEAVDLDDLMIVINSWGASG